MKKMIVLSLFIFFTCFSFAQGKYDTVKSAVQKVGQEVTISGTVVGTYYTGAENGSLLFINLDYKYPENPITIIISRDYRMEFPMVTEFEKKEVIIKGFLQKNKNGSPTIFLKKESQMVILERTKNEEIVGF